MASQGLTHGPSCLLSVESDVMAVMLYMVVGTLSCLLQQARWWRSSWNMLLACLFMSEPWFYSQAQSARTGFFATSVAFGFQGTTAAGP